jgi:hypothetical protein
MQGTYQELERAVTYKTDSPDIGLGVHDKRVSGDDYKRVGTACQQEPTGRPRRTGAAAGYEWAVLQGKAG